MTNEDLYKLTLTILRKESRGNIVKPGRFSELLKQCHYEYYAQQYEKYALSQTITDSLQPFLVLDDAVTFATGSEDLSDLSSTYRHAIGLRVGTVDVDLVTPKEWIERQDDVLTAPSAADPIAIVTATTLQILPNTITSGSFTYLKEADNEPFFDYYIDANRNVQWMGVNAATHSLGTSEVYRDGTSSGTVTSINRELEWDDKDKLNILSFILEKLGVSLSGDIAQYAMAKEQQQNTI